MPHIHFNTPVPHDWCLAPQSGIAATPVLQQNNEEAEGCKLNYPHYHAMGAHAINSAIDDPWANSLVHNAMTIFEGQPMDFPMRWRSMPWPTEIYPPIQGHNPPNDGYMERVPGAKVYDGVRISTILHGLAPLYYPRGFFNTIGLHNIKLVILRLQRLRCLESVAPRTEALDEIGQDGEAGLSFKEMTEYRVPTPPWLEGLTPCDVPTELDPRPTEEAEGKESLRIKIDLKRLLPPRDVPVELYPCLTEETSKGTESLKIRIDPRRLKVLHKK